ncbi:hypothetical protein DCAR_0728202 [Daucus carota subsp. sativus]|uniref:Uncharacterized protein n=1 Tax=Daucus carota subsp. sativus TaxID=79200 RepID=A0AAF0XKZ3_DAUCS|nr:hypothetical protein DCAR_0728202 [Daucus carota subsp. sativus]
MVKIAELTGHTPWVLFACQTENEKLRFWNVIGTPKASIPTPIVAIEPFAQWTRIR